MDLSLAAPSPSPDIQKKIFEDVSDELMCVVCGCVLIDPRVLRCQHCFCLRCLFSQSVHDRSDSITLSCVYRCSLTTTTEGDIRSLPRNPIITNMVSLVRREQARRLKSKYEERQQQKQQQQREGVSGGAGVTDDAEELWECEWCSRTSESCEFCSQCLSRLCGDCRGQFSDHQFLCVQGGSPSTGAGADETAASSLSNRTYRQGGAALGLAYPFLLPPSGVMGVLNEELIKQYPQVILSKIKLCSLAPTTLRCHVSTVECRQVLTNITATLDVYRPVKVRGFSMQIPASSVHWAQDDPGLDALLFLSNMLRIGGNTLANLDSLSSEMALLQAEVTSAARRILAERNRGFHLFALHCALLARQQVMLVRLCILPYLMKALTVGCISADAVSNRYRGQFSRSETSQRYAIHHQALCFLKLHNRLAGQHARMLDNIAAAAVGVELVVTDIFSWLLQFSADDTSSAPVGSKKSSSRQRSSHLDRSQEPIFEVLADATFLGQFEERYTSTIQPLTRMLLSTMDDFMRARHWIWTHTNTSLRACGLGEDVHDALLGGEEQLQTKTDELISTMCLLTRLLFTGESVCVYLNEDVNVKDFTRRLVTIAVESFEFPPPVDLSSENATVMEHDGRVLRELYFQLESSGRAVPDVDMQQHMTSLMEQSFSSHQNKHRFELTEIVDDETRALERFRAFIDALSPNCMLLSPSTECSSLLPSIIRQLIVLDDVNLLRECSLDMPADGRLTRHMVDYCRREVTFGVSSRFGKRLVDAAHGVRPSNTDNQRQSQENNQALQADASSAMESPSLFPRPLSPPPSVHSSSPLDPSSPRSGFSTSPSADTLAFPESPKTPHSPRGDDDEQERSTMDEQNGGRRIRLFAADQADDIVKSLSCVVDQDEDGQGAAGKAFTSYYRVACNQTTLLRSTERVLPFYAGSFQYNSNSKKSNFLVDAQTGEVWLENRVYGTNPNHTARWLGFFLGNVALKIFLRVFVNAKE